MKQRRTIADGLLSEERLHKVLAAAGVGARRKCEELVAAGKVSVNGEVIRDLGFKLNPGSATIEVQGKKIDLNTELVYYLINKPAGMLSTCADPQNRSTVLDLIPDCDNRLFPVGRLDRDSQGLMLLTNDGEAAQILTHPKYEVEKEYLVKVRGIPAEAVLQRAKRGIRLEDGPARAKLVEIHSKTDSNSWLRVVVTEGRNRLIKRMFKALGHPVMKLKRIRLFYLRLGDIPERAVVPLQPKQADMLIKRLRKLAIPDEDEKKQVAKAGPASGNSPRRKAVRRPPKIVRPTRTKKTRRTE
ncbi:MAG: rRNA pseudouridine synthase [Candidatus Coatesbacteria bacterium]|nr:rRNA pseudouridine synthase [Candidatus Coatesbacteria bacterium]